jgi:hypothetical protein
MAQATCLFYFWMNIFAQVFVRIYSQWLRCRYRVRARLERVGRGRRQGSSGVEARSAKNYHRVQMGRFGTLC